MHGLDAHLETASRVLFAEDVPKDAIGNVSRILSAITPSRKRKARYTTIGDAGEDTADAASSEASSLTLVYPEETDTMDRAQQLDAIAGQWAELVGKVNQTIRGLRTLGLAVGEDMDEVDEKVLKVEALIGRAGKDAGFEDFGSVWDGLCMLRGAADESNLTGKGDRYPQILARINQVVEERCQLAEATAGRYITSMKAGLDELTDLVSILSAKQGVISNQVLEGTRGHSTTPTVEVLQLRQQVQDLAKRCITLENETLAHGPGSGFSGGAAGDVASLTLQMKMLEARLPAHASHPLGGQNFRSRNDVQVFVEKYIPSSSFALYHNAVTILESLGGNHTEKKDVLTEVY